MQKRILFVSKILSGLEIIIGLSAVYGGYLMVQTNGMGIPQSWLLHSPFRSFVFPGIMLMGIIGGVYIVSSYMLFTGKKYALEVSAVAGFGLLIWTFSELFIILHTSFLQILYFGLGIMMLILTFLLLRMKNLKS